MLLFLSCSVAGLLLFSESCRLRFFLFSLSDDVSRIAPVKWLTMLDDGVFSRVGVDQPLNITCVSL